MMSFLKNIDVQLFFWINHHHALWLDEFFWYVSNKYVWIPFYLWIFCFFIKVYKKSAWIYILTAVLLIIFTDQLSVHLFKNVFQRLRPCHDETIRTFVHLYKGKCGGMYGFISSHATNASALAMFVWLLLRNKFSYKRWLGIFFLSYVFLIGYSRIYLGQHYPSDVVVGILVGIFSAWFFYRILIAFQKS